MYDDVFALERAEWRAIRRARLRRWWSALRAWSGTFPAVLATVLALSFGVAAVTRSGSATAAAYGRHAHRAFRNGDYPAARIAFSRLAAAPNPPPEALFGLAETFEALGEPERATRLWDQLAPPDHPGFAPAQVRRARLLLKRPSGGPAGTRAAAAAENHLRRALDSDPGSFEARTLLGNLLLALRRPGEAAPLLGRAAEKDPELRLTAVAAYAAAGRRESALWQAQVASREAAQRLMFVPDDFAARLRLARSAVFLDDYSTASRVLRLGLERTGDSRYRRPLADVYCARADAEARKDPGDLASALLWLEDGLRVDPTSGPLLERFGRALKAGGPAAERGRKLLREYLARGRGGAGAHFTLGLDAWFRGDRDAARLHLEEAARLDPKGPSIANNLGWVLAHGPDPDLPRALAMADLALDLRPGEPRFRGTRGAALALLGRWKDALPDLEAGLTTDSNDPDLHNHLADVYEHLGVPDMAATHRGLGARPGRVTPPPAGIAPADEIESGGPGKG